MNFEDFRKQKSVKVLSEHELNDDQLERLIEDKLNRAKAYRNSFLKPRKDELVEQD